MFVISLFCSFFRCFLLQILLFNSRLFPNIHVSTSLKFESTENGVYEDHVSQIDGCSGRRVKLRLTHKLLILNTYSIILYGTIPDTQAIQMPE